MTDYDSDYDSDEDIVEEIQLYTTTPEKKFEQNSIRNDTILKKIPDDVMDHYFNTINAKPTSLIRKKITATNFEKYVAKEAPSWTKSNGDFLNYWVDNYWTKLQLHNYLVKLMKLTKTKTPNLPISRTRYNIEWGSVENPTKKKAVDYFIRQRRYELYVYAIRLLRKKLKQKKIEMIDIAKNLKHGLYKPGMRLSSNIIDHMQQDTESSKIQHLLHCKNINYEQIVTLFNFMMTWLSETMQNYIMDYLIYHFSEKYNISIDTNTILSNAQKKKITKRIMLRIEKYDFCQMMNVVGLENWLISNINAKLIVSAPENSDPVGSGAGTGAGAVE